MACVKLERTERGSSMSSWITLAMNALHAAFAEGVNGCVHWPATRCPRAYFDAEAFSRRPNMFDWYFHQPWCEQDRAAADETWRWEHAYVLADRHPIVDLSAFFRRYLIFNADVADRFERLSSSYGLHPSRTIALAWRGTDNVVDGRPRVPIESFFPVVDRLLDAEPDLAIVAKPEERGAAEMLLRRYPNAIVPQEFFIAESGEPLMQDWVNPASGYERGMQVALLMLLYSKCRYLLKNNANLSDIATRLSTGTVFSWTSATDYACIQQRTAE